MTNESLEAHAEVLEQIPTAWRSAFESCPHSLRDEFLTIINAGNLSPEVYSCLAINIEQTDDIKTMGPGYHDPEERRIAEADCHKRIIRFLKTEQDYPPEFRAHVLRHEIGHFASYYIDPEEYQAFIASRPMKGNGQYIQALARNESPHLRHEMLADDLADYFVASDASDMLTRRLTRAGTLETLTALSDIDRQTLYDEAKGLFDFFRQSLDPDRAVNDERFLEDFEQEWDDLDNLEAVDSIQTVPNLVGASYWRPPTQAAPKTSQYFDFFTWLFTSEPS